MPISLKNDEAEEAARQLAALTGETLTQTIHIALTERLERVRRERAARSRLAELTSIAQRCARRPVVSRLSDDDILGYDEWGIPTR